MAGSQQPALQSVKHNENEDIEARTRLQIQITFNVLLKDQYKGGEDEKGIERCVWTGLPSDGTRLSVDDILESKTDG